MIHKHYILHFSFAMSDQTLSWLLEEKGLEGYGTFCILIEILSQQEKQICEIKVITKHTRELRVGKEVLISVVIDYKLFIIKEVFLLS